MTSGRGGVRVRARLSLLALAQGAGKGVTGVEVMALLNEMGSPMSG